jgi:hypothetical protein
MHQGEKLMQGKVFVFGPVTYGDVGHNPQTSNNLHGGGVVTLPLTQSIGEGEAFRGCGTAFFIEGQEIVNIMVDGCVRVWVAGGEVGGDEGIQPTGSASRGSMGVSGVTRDGRYGRGDKSFSGNDGSCVPVLIIVTYEMNRYRMGRLDIHGSLLEGATEVVG